MTVQKPNPTALSALIRSTLIQTTEYFPSPVVCYNKFSLEKLKKSSTLDSIQSQRRSKHKGSLNSLRQRKRSKKLCVQWVLRSCSSKGQLSKNDSNPSPHIHKDDYQCYANETLCLRKRWRKLQTELQSTAQNMKDAVGIFINRRTTGRVVASRLFVQPFHERGASPPCSPPQPSCLGAVGGHLQR